MAAAIRECREALGEELSEELASLPTSMRIDAGTEVGTHRR